MASGAAEDTALAPPAELTTAEIAARRWQLVAISLLVIAIDQISKAWALNSLADRDIEGPFGSSLRLVSVSYTHLRAHETREDLVCRLLLEKKKK